MNIAHLLKHRTETTVEVMVPQPEVVGPEMQHFRYPTGTHWRSAADYATDFAPHHPGETVRVPWKDDPYKERMYNEYQSPSEGHVEATVVSVTAKQVSKMTNAERLEAGMPIDDICGLDVLESDHVWVINWKLKQ